MKKKYSIPQARILLVCVWLFLIHTGFCIAEDSIDDLFDDPSTGIIEGDPESQNTALDMESLTGGSSTKVGGTFTLSGGLGLFLTQWPWELSEPVAELSDVLDYSVGYLVKSTAYLDARPNSYTRFYTTISAGLDASSLKLTSPVLGEMFVDYTFAEKVSFRLGKFAMTWGQGGLLSNPGNLVSMAVQGAAVRAFIPLGANGLGLVTYGTAAMGGVSPRSLAYAGQFDTVIGDFVTGLSAHYRYSESLRTVYYLKRSFNGLDLGTELRLDWGGESSVLPWYQPVSFFGIANLYYEIIKTIKWRFGVEYYLDGEDPAFTAHFLGAGLVISNLPLKGWRPGLSIKHSVQDNSGEIRVGFDGPLWPGITAVLGLDMKYGPEGAFYRPGGSLPVGAGLEIKLSHAF